MQSENDVCLALYPLAWILCVKEICSEALNAKKVGKIFFLLGAFQKVYTHNMMNDSVLCSVIGQFFLIEKEIRILFFM